jgi:hypothetical protein
MSTISINTPDGSVLNLNAPDGATPEQIHSAAQMAVSHYVQNSKPTMNPDGFLNQLKMAGRAFLGGSQPDPTNNVVQAGANKTGEDIATSKLGQKFPEVGAGIGTAVQMSPDLLSLMAIPGARNAAQAGDLGMVGRVISGPGASEAGEAMGAAEKAVGINNDIVPTLKDVSSNLGLRTANSKQYLNALMERLKSGEEMGPQSLSQHHKMIAELLTKEPSALAQTLGLPSKLGKPAVAQAAKINKMLVERLNSVTPGRAAEAANYAAAMFRNKIYKGAAGAAVSYYGSPLLKALFKHTSGSD